MTALVLDANLARALRDLANDLRDDFDASDPSNDPARATHLVERAYEGVELTPSDPRDFDAIDALDAAGYIEYDEDVHAWRVYA